MLIFVPVHSEFRILALRNTASRHRMDLVESVHLFIRLFDKVEVSVFMNIVTTTENGQLFLVGIYD